LRTRLHRGLKRASALSGLSCWLVSYMIAGTATEEAGFLWLGVPLNGHGRLHLTLVNVAKIRDHNHLFCVAEDLLEFTERR
jgi:hypothetical protein